MAYPIHHTCSDMKLIAAIAASMDVSITIVSVLLFTFTDSDDIIMYALTIRNTIFDTYPIYNVDGFN